LILKNHPDLKLNFFLPSGKKILLNKSVLRSLPATAAGIPAITISMSIIRGFAMKKKSITDKIVPSTLTINLISVLENLPSTMSLNTTAMESRLSISTISGSTSK